MDSTRKNVALLSLSQGLLLTNNSIMIATNGLAGFVLAPDKGMATFPVTGYVVGSALVTMQMSLLMRRLGRRAGFMLGVGLGMLGASICGLAAYLGSFWLLCLGTFVAGAYNAAGQYYRFAAADSAAPEFRSTVISLVLAGGILGGILGPETSKLTKDALAGHPFVGSYFSLVGFGVLALVVLWWLRIPGLSAAERAAPGRPLAEIVAQPAFIVAALTGMVGYGAMNLLMTATPLAMMHHHPYRAAAFVIEGHVVGMFLPSFFTGRLVQRFGVLQTILVGVLLTFVCVVIAQSGLDVVHFWSALVLLGVGWNFMYVGATTLLAEVYTPAERAKTQGANDSLIFVTMAFTSAASGFVFTREGWEVMNWSVTPFLAGCALATLWLLAARRRQGA
ncbi:MAG: MFS transporter [Candidatus Rokubacteria bacterium]|nr:MFS transporter [Candidatus Rokubacteria bacterium]